MRGKIRSVPVRSSGTGRLTMHLQNDEDEIKHGYYHYSTTDGGKTWRGPNFEADDTDEGDELRGELRENLKERIPLPNNI